MERLIKDASQMKDIQEKLGVTVDANSLSFGNIVNAISVMQNSLDISGYSTEQLNDKLKNMSLTQDELQKVAKDMGISYEEATERMKNGTLTVKDASILLGTTAREATETVSGSLNMMKASWENLLVGLADKNANVEELINNLVDSVSIFAENLLPVIEQAIVGIGTLIEKLLPVIAQRIPAIFNEVLPQLIESGVNIVGALITGIQQNLPVIIEGALTIIQTFVDGVLPLLPRILYVGMTLIIELIKGITEKIPELMPTILEIIMTIVKVLTENLPLLLKAGIQIISALINGIVPMIPELIPIMVDAIITIVDALIDNIDQLIDAGIELILALADGLIEALPRLIEKAPVIIQKLVDAIIRNFPKIVQAGGELLGKLVMGILGAISKLIEVAPKLISTIRDGLRRGFEEIRNVGKYLLEGLWNGISDKAQWLRQQLESLGGNIVNWAKKVLKIGSPSKVFRDEVGRWIPEGIAVGIEADTDSALKSLDKMNDEMLDRMNKAVNFETAKSSFTGISGSVSEILNTNSTIQVDNYNTLELDGEKVYENQQRIQKNKNLQYAFGG